MDQGRLLGDRYRLDVLLGQGGMGSVWLAHDVVLGRNVAIKKVAHPPGLDDGEQDVLNARTFREARASARLRHPGIVSVYDVLEVSGQTWIVSELIDGRSLRDVLTERGPLPPSQVTEVARQLLEALRHAHDAGLVHRDIKPGNVLLSDTGRAVLIDFGTAHIELTSMTAQAGPVLGSPAFLPPELMEGEQAGPASDLWSLGATLYMAVEGRSPYERHSAIATVTAALTEPVPPPRNAGPLARVLEGLLRRDPAQRPSAGEALSMLDEAINAPDSGPPLPTPRATVTPLTAEDASEIGPYTLIGRLGQGGTGVVYKARDGDDRDVAVRLSRRDTRWRLDPDARNVQGSGLARVLDTGVFEGRAYLVNEFVDGLSLRDYVERRGPMSGGQLERLAVGTATALTALHRAGVVHRNLKPANVLLGRDGPRVVDYGIGPPDEEPGTLFGAPGYMAPELFQGGAPSPATDVFAWAVTMVFAATGRRLFGGTGTTEIVQGTLHDEPDLAGVPEGPLREVLTACLAKDPSRRPATADLVRNLLVGRRKARPVVAGRADLDLPPVWSADSAAAPPPGSARSAKTRISLWSPGSTVPVALLAAALVLLLAVQAEAEQVEFAGVIAGLVIGAVAVCGAAFVTVRGAVRWLRARRALAPPGDDVARARDLIARGLYAEAETVLTDVVKDGRPAAPEVYGNLAVALLGLGRHSEAERLLSETLRPGSRGAETIDLVVGSRLAANLAAVRHEAGFPEAVDQLEEALAASESLADSGARTVPVRSNLSAALHDAGRLEEAEEHASTALRDAVDEGGDRSPAALRARANLAAVRRDLGHPAEAVDLLQRTFKDAKRVLGRRHPQTLTIQASLAALLHETGEHRAAAKLLRDVVDRRTKAFGTAHPATLQARTNLGFLHLAQQDVTAAREDFRRVLADGDGAGDADAVLTRAHDGLSQALLALPWPRSSRVRLRRASVTMARWRR
ncbi:serine/threonine protein kinase [Actinomadura soli]|uniref:non-specific serine/threonine protein kinase n=1 Tax=Actinomadura soli TaxID=2508997 RepID=A0A5C4JJN0_9ACTN|nr:serine/threonine-protein kinase [Actinomadura soli]TMR07019.1 serine/threonine protein kinase [Actinomadura soli]